MGRVREEKRRRKNIKKKSQKKEDPGARKGRKVAKHCVFPMICGSGGSRSRLAKAAGADTSGQMTREKLHAVVARSTFPSQNVQSTSCSDHVSKLRCRKSARRCGATHISKSKCTKHLSFGALLQVAMSKKCTPLWREARFQVKMYKIPRLGALLEVAMSKKCTPLWREAHFEVKSVKTAGDGTLLDVQMSFRVAGARDCAPCQKWEKREAFVAFPKAMASAEEDLPRCIFRGRRSAIDMFIRDVRRSGRWFPERGCILRFAEMILRDRCSTSYDLASLFRGRRNTLDRWSGKIAKLIGTRPSALHSTFHFWRKSHKIVSFLMLSTSKAEEVSQTCFVFGVAKFRSWGSLAELFRFWRCQVQKLRQNCFVFDVVKFKNRGRLAELLRFQAYN